MASPPLAPDSPPGRPDLDRVRSTQALLIAAAILDAVFPAIVASLDATQPRLDPWRHTVSRHARAPGFPWMEVAFMAHGLAMALLAVALRRLSPGAWAAPTALWLGAVASFLLAVFPADAGGTETVWGHVHESIAPVAFIAVMVAALLTWRAQRRSHFWAGLERLPRFFAFFLAGSLAAFGLLLAIVQATDAPRIVLGATERLVVVGIAGWVLAMTIQGVRVQARLR